MYTWTSGKAIMYSCMDGHPHEAREAQSAFGEQGTLNAGMSSSGTES